MLESFNPEALLNQHILLFVCDASGKIMAANERFCERSGYSLEDLTGKHFSSMGSGAQGARFFSKLETALKDGEIWQGELSNLTREGEFYWLLSSFTPYMDRAGNLVKFIAIHTDITEQKRAVLNYEHELIKLSTMAEDLSMSRDAAVRADRVKSEFLAGLSNSFRTPMSSILGFAQMLERSSLSKNDKEHLEYSREILQAGRTLLETIDDLLEWSRVEAGTVNLKIEPQPLSSLVSDVMEELRPNAEKREVSLLSPSNSTLVYAEYDSYRMHQVLYALLTLAVNNNRTGGWVSVDIQHSDNEAKVVISDSGYGLPADYIECVTNPGLCAIDSEAFYLSPGLSLLLSMSLMRAMGGALDIASQIEIGTTLTISLPLSSAEESDQGAAAKVSLGRPLLILSVDDNLANARLLSAYLERIEGVTLLEANTAFHGLKLATEHKPDVIFMDIQLPGMDGYEALKRIKSDIRMAQCKVAALTSESHPEQVRRGLKAGFDAYLTKPLMFETLLKAMESLTKSSRTKLLPERPGSH